MSEHITEKVISSIDDQYIFEAVEYIGKRSRTFDKVLRRLGGMAACLCIIFIVASSSISIAVVGGNIPAYDILYSLYPDLAMKLTPVKASCEDNGIKMEVESIYVHGDAADIYISMQDLTGNRIDETTDLFDSYSINTSCDQISGCGLVGYDADSKTATFLISVQQMRKEKITGKKLTFSVSKFLSGKKEVYEELADIDFENIPVAGEIQTEVNLRGGDRTGDDSFDDIPGFLIPDDSQRFSIVEGAAVTTYGYVDGQLHVQVYYDNILDYDNHGDIYLKDADGNVLQCMTSVAFWDDEEAGSYEDYIFDISPEDNVDGCSIWGYFCTTKMLTTGNWEVSVPIENKE